jgi:hypothetical protein
MNHQANSKAFRQKLILWMLLLLFSGSVMWGQAPEISFYDHSLRINNTGMLVLGSWALANISLGAVGWSKNDGQRMYFHQMNLFWNTVNLSIAAIALYSNLNAEYGMWSVDEILRKQLKTQHLFLINAGLDLAYMGTGLLLKNLTNRYPNHRERLAGYGNSVLMQGAFLFAFDLIMFGLQHSHRARFMDQLAVGPAQDAYGIALMVHF